MSLENPLNENTLKRIFDTDSELSQKQIMPSKTTISWLFNDIRCYLFIVWFDWKIPTFQQTVVRVYYILKKFLSSLNMNKAGMVQIPAKFLKEPPDVLAYTVPRI